MESFDDDDGLALAMPEKPSSPLPKPKLRRLKKAASPSLLQPLAEPKVTDAPAKPVSAAAPDPTEIGARSSNGMETEGFDEERGPETDLDPLLVFRSSEERRGDPCMPDRKVNEVGSGKDEDEVFVEELKKEKTVKRRLSLEDEEEDLNKRKKKKGRSRKLIGPEGKPKESAREIKRLEKARKAELEHLHAESQRLLRETRDASFKPVQLIQKPISSVLEKIRLRKLELLKRCNLPSSIPSGADADCLHGSNCSSDPVNSQSDVKETDENAKLAFDVGSKGTYQKPTNDAQADKTSSQTSVGADNLLNVQEPSPPFPPSSSLKIDGRGNDGSASSSGDYDVSSSEEESDKENIGPSACNVVNMDSSPKFGLAKAFLDDEAEEEDDSDCDMLRFPDIEEEDEIDEHEELDDLIAIGYEELPMDQEKRNELHQKWLEQQDATETDNVLQRLKGGQGHGKPAFLHGDYDNYDGSDNDNDGNDSDDSGYDEAVDKHPIDASHQNLKKAKQMISHMFTDSNDVYIPSDDEETEKNLIRHHILKQNEEPSIISPVEDEKSRDFFGLIKKLNIASGTKKRGKSSASALFDSLVLPGSSNSASKSSFLKRACNSLPPLHKQGSSSVRTFIFGRDDSNSKSNISASEINSEMAQKGCSTAQNPMTDKFSSSQLKSSILERKVQAHSETGSLFNILRKSSIQFDKSFESKDYDSSSHVITESQAAYKFSAFKLKKNSKVDSRT